MQGRVGILGVVVGLCSAALGCAENTSSTDADVTAKQVDQVVEGIQRRDAKGYGYRVDIADGADPVFAIQRFTPSGKASWSTSPFAKNYLGVAMDVRDDGRTALAVSFGIGDRPGSFDHADFHAEGFGFAILVLDAKGKRIYAKAFVRPDACAANGYYYVPTVELARDGKLAVAIEDTCTAAGATPLFAGLEADAAVVSSVAVLSPKAGNVTWVEPVWRRGVGRSTVNEGIHDLAWNAGGTRIAVLGEVAGAHEVLGSAIGEGTTAGRDVTVFAGELDAAHGSPLARVDAPPVPASITPTFDGIHMTGEGVSFGPDGDLYFLFDAYPIADGTGIIRADGADTEIVAAFSDFYPLGLGVDAEGVVWTAGTVDQGETVGGAELSGVSGILGIDADGSAVFQDAGGAGYLLDVTVRGETLEMSSLLDATVKDPRSSRDRLVWRLSKPSFGAED